MPNDPFEAISTLELVNPAAPISWIDKTASVLINSRQDSKSNFPVKGSPTWTVGLFSELLSVNSVDAIVAPCIPSLPVLAPTYITGLPAPVAAE